MRIAYSSIAFGKISNEKTFLRSLQMMEASHYAGVQLEYDLLPRALKNDPKKVRRIVKDANLEIVAVAVTLDPKSVQFASEVDGIVGTLCLFESDQKRALAGTRNISQFASSLGMDVAIHPHVKSNVQSISDIDKFLDAGRDDKPNFPSVVFDTAHFTSLCFDFSNFAKRYKKSISIVHIKDLRYLVSPDQLDYHKDFLDVGEGIVDFGSALSALESINYSKWLVVEIDHPEGGDVEKSIKRNYKRLTKLLRSSSS